MNSDNLGVGALTLSNAELLREAARRAGVSAQFLAMSWVDRREDYGTWPDIENLPFRTRHLPGPSGPLAEGLKRADIVFDIGGGDSFTDIYGPKRFLTVWGTKFHALRMGRPLVLSPQTLGPFESRWARLLARWSMNRARLVVTRDGPSTAFARQLGVRGPLLEATDVAMRLPYAAPPARTADGKVRVGLNVSGLLFNGGYTQSNQFGLKADYPALVRRIVQMFRDRPEVELHLVGHVQSREIEVEDDQRVGERLAAEFPGTIVAPVFTSPSEAKSYIAGMDFFVGARMHATIAAFSARVPVIPMAYSRKFAGVFGTLGYSHVADCKSDSAEEILARIARGYDGRAALSSEIDAALTRVDARLERYIDLAAEELARLRPEAAAESRAAGARPGAVGDRAREA